MTEDPSKVTINDHILAACKLIAIELFAGADISKPVQLSSNESFDVINKIIKENYNYTLGKFTYMFTVRKTLKNVASDYGVNLTLI